MKKVLLSLFIVACLFVVTGCGKSSSSKISTGKYKLIELVNGDQKITSESLEVAGFEYTLTIKDGNKAILDMEGKEELEYDDKYFYPSDDKEAKVPYTYKDGKIVISPEENYSMTFEK